MEHEPSLESGPSSPPWNTTLKVVVGVLAVILIGLAAYAFRAVFVPVILGCIIAYVLSPVVRDLTLSLPLPRVVATLLVFLAVIAIVIPVGVLGIQELIREAATFGNRLIAAIQTLSEMGGDTIHILGFEIVIGTLQDQIAAQLTSTIRDMIPSTVNFALSAARTVVFGVFTLFIGFYLTRDADRIVVSIKKLVPPAYRADADALLGEINSVWAAFLRGQVILALIVTVILTGVSAALGLPQPLLLGVWGGLLEFLPSIGNMIWGATAITLAIVEGSSTLSLPTPVFVLVVVIAYVAFAQLDMNVLIPNIL
ncbi:MAG TPA: AI-2E family transporter, partial [Aggregatilineales bacterium]|nr:AI-2E family transporter [Aggregatilineales bacterium]